MTMRNYKVRDIMSEKLVTLHPKDKLLSAKELFEKYMIHHIPVCVMSDVRGIISLGDILYLEGVVTCSFDEFVKNKKLETLDVDEVMTKRPYLIDGDRDISDALDIMLDKNVNALPVVDEGELVGIVTSYDMMKFLRNKLINKITES